MNRFLYIVIVFLFCSIGLSAQNRVIDGFMAKYSNTAGFSSVSMNEPSIIMQNETGDEAEIGKDMLKGIETIKSLTYKPVQGKVSDEGKSFSSEIAKINAGEGFIEIMSLNEGRSKVKSLIRKSGDKVVEFIMVVAGENESTLIWMNGDINLQNVTNIGRILQLRGFDKSGTKSKRK